MSMSSALSWPGGRLQGYLKECWQGAHAESCTKRSALYLSEGPMSCFVRGLMVGVLRAVFRFQVPSVSLNVLLALGLEAKTVSNTMLIALL